MKTRHHRWLVAPLVALLAALVLVWGTTSEPAQAYVDGSTIVPVSVAVGGGATVTGATATAVCASTVVCGLAAVGTVAVGYAGYRVLKWAWGAGHDVEQPSYLAPSTTSTYGGGYWSKLAGGTKTAGEVPQDGVAWTYGGLTFTSTIDQIGARQTAHEIRVRQTWAGGLFPTPTTPNWYRIRVMCMDGSFRDFDFGAQAYASGLVAGSVSYIFPAVTCQTGAGVDNVRFYTGPNTNTTDTNRYTPGTVTPTYPDATTPPDHKWRSEKRCSDGNGNETVLTVFSTVFKEADATLPGMPSPDCPSIMPKVEEWNVYEGDANGAGGPKVVEWNAPTETQTAEVSDCLPGGSAYPCSLRLLKIINGQPTTCTTADCTSFDPDTSLDTEYQCKWGAYLMPLSDCTEPKPNPQPSPTDTDTGSFPDPDVVNPDDRVDIGPNPQAPNTSCLGGGWGWNPIEWVLKPVKCALAWAFIPSDTSGWVDAWNGSVVQSLFTPVDALIETWDGFSDGLSGAGGCEGLTANVPNGAGGSFTFQPLNTCNAPVSTVALGVRTLLGAVFLVGGLLGAARLVLRSFGIHTAAVGESTPA
jgi:hypothetical protein